MRHARTGGGPNPDEVARCVDLRRLPARSGRDDRSLPPPSQRAAGSLKQAVENSVAAATGAGSARITVQFFSGSNTGKVVQDSSLDSGKQTVAIGKGLASTLLTGGAAYISGNGAGMTSYFGLPSPLVQTLAGRWISVQPTDSAYKSVTATCPSPRRWPR